MAYIYFYHIFNYKITKHFSIEFTNNNMDNLKYFMYFHKEFKGFIRTMC